MQDEQLHLGKLKGVGKSVWHTDDNGNFWCGNWDTRSAVELYLECKSVIDDLEKLYPKLFIQDRELKSED